MDMCSSYHTETGEARCWGTREMDPCSCGGDRRQCSFYPEVREQAEREHPRMNRTLPEQLRAMEAGYKRMSPHARSLIQQAASEIERLQAALEEKAGEIVRCRECKCRAEDDFCTGRGWPNQLVADDGLCEKGKRRDGGQDT